MWIKVLRTLPLSRTNKLSLVLSTVFQAVLELAGLAVLVPVLLLVLQDQGIQNNKYLQMIYDFIGVEHYGTFLLIVLFFVVVFIILKNFVLHKMNNYRNRVLLKIYTTYSSNLYDNYISKGLQYVKENGHTTLSHNILAVTYQFVFGYLSSTLMLVADILLCLLVFVSLCFVNVYIAALEIILFTPIVLFYHYKIAGKMQEAGRVDNKAKRDLWRITSETFRGFADVVVNRFLPYLHKSFDAGVRDVSRSKIRVERLKSLSSKSVEVAIMLMIVGFVAGFYFIGDSDRQFLPLIGIFAAASLKLLPSVRSILSLIGTMRNTGYTLDVLFKAETETVGKTESIGRFDTAGTSETDAVSGNAPEVATGAEEPLTFNKFIEFRHVNFGFDPGEPVLRDVSFRIQKGERVGISGPTGKGKSTLMYLMMGLYRPQNGTILVDGVPLGPKNLDAWHTLIGYVSQDVFITEGTLAQNVTPFGGDDRGQLEDSLKTASLSDWLATLPQGVDTPIGESGSRLSGGERQRLGIARAHFKKAEILFMDEPTSSLDPATEADITGTLLEEFMNRNKTVVIISHRDSLLAQCNRIIDISEWTR